VSTALAAGRLLLASLNVARRNYEKGNTQISGSHPAAGRAATGKDPVRAIRLSDEFLKKVDGWAAKQEDKPGRSEAVRRLVEIGLRDERTEAVIQHIAKIAAEHRARLKAKPKG
jgi:hypothetical protein